MTARCECGERMVLMATSTSTLYPAYELTCPDEFHRMFTRHLAPLLRMEGKKP